MYDCVHNNYMFLRCINRSGPFRKSGHILYYIILLLYCIDIEQSI